MSTETEPNRPGSSSRMGVVLLAAGRSRRMGRPKLLLPWRDSSILGDAIQLWRSLGVEHLAVAHAVDDDPMEKELDRLGLTSDQRIPNPFPDQGMFSSIQAAARWGGWRKDLTRWAIVLGDQPRARPATLRSLLDFSARQPSVICQPSRRGRPRHPVVLPSLTFASLAGSKAKDLKEFLSPLSRALMESDDEGLDLDVDTPADYRAAVAMESFFSRGRERATNLGPSHQR